MVGTLALLLNCQSVSKSFGALPLFHGVSLTISEGDRLGVIGPNGSGKTTLMRILAGLDTPDSGECSLRKLTRLCYVPQDSVFPPGTTVRQVLEASCTNREDLEARLAQTLGVAGFTDASQQAASLSGGWRKRLAIAEALIATPDILLLDEPTNHLDLEGILWLERLIASSRFATVMVSHDRYFLENTATAMAELNKAYPGGIFQVEGNYSRFLEKRAEYLAAQVRLQESLESKVRREVEWLQRGAKARTTKAKARVDEANRLISQLDDVTSRQRSSTAQIDFTASGRQTKRLIDAREVSCEVGGRMLFRALNLSLAPGVRVGLAGANGTGKTTLLRLLQGSLPPASGTIERADNLRIVYFDQHRERLDPEVPLKRALAEYGDSVQYRGRVIHVAGWAKRFLFRPEQLEVAVGSLSGGERARVQIARLMLEPADVLLLDEPTNDLDIPTLDVLEESLADFPGALVLVTHDRFLLDRVSTTVVGLDGEAGAEQFADYEQWLQALSEKRRAAALSRPAAGKAAAAPREQRKKLSYMEAREWESMEERILEAEALLEAKKALLSDPGVVTDGQRLRQAYDEMSAAQAAADQLYARWAELEEKLK